MNLLVFPSQDNNAVTEAWHSGDDTRLVAALVGLKEGPSTLGEKSSVADVLRATTSRHVRNAAALALVDMGAEDMVNVLVDTLRNQNLAKDSGTLLFSLLELNAKLPLDVILVLIANGSYEARAETLTFLEEGRVERYDGVQAKNALRTLRTLADSNDAETAEVADLALKYFISATVKNKKDT